MSSRAQIKANFQTGDVPTQAHFADLVDSLAHASEDSLATTTQLSAHTSDTSNPHAVTKAQVGLGSVDNTSDMGKPISTAMQVALDAKQVALVSGTNIKTINGASVLGVGNLVVTGDGTGIGYDELIATRTDSTQVFPDPFLADAELNAPGEKPFTLLGGWTSVGKRSDQKYTAGKVLVRPTANVTLPELRISLDKLNIVPGDVIQIITEARYTGNNSATSGAFLAGSFWNRGFATNLGNITPLTATVQNPMDSTLRRFTTGSVTVPAGAAIIWITAPLWATGEWCIESFQIVKSSVAAADRPIQNEIPSNLVERLEAVESANMSAPRNNLLLRRTSYSALEVVRETGGASMQTAFSGYGQSYQASVVPTGGFNAIRDLWKWIISVDAPVRIYVEVTTSATGTNPLNSGNYLASGYIDVDPTSGTAGNEPILLYGPDGQPRTIMPADVSDLVGFSYVGIKANGRRASGLFVTQGANAFTDPALPNRHIPQGTFEGIGDGWTNLATTTPWCPQLVMLTNPVTTADKASAKLAGSIAERVAEQPNLIALPKKMWCLVGRPCWVHYATIQTRDHRTNSFNSSSTSSVSRNQTDGFVHTASGAGNVTVSITGEANGIETAAKSVVFSSVATSTGAGTARFLMLGDSMTANGSMQSRLNALAVGDVTSVVNMGTVGADPVKNEGYSGQQNGIFFSPGNPFYNPSTQDFDFTYYMTNLGVANPTHVLLASGFWHVASATSDAEVVVNAGSLIAQFERMITSIRARSTSIKVGIWTNPVQPYDGQDGESQQVTPISSARRRRNAILLGAQMIEAFSDREAGGVYSVCCGQTMNPQTGYPRSELVPVDAAIAARISTTTYANYAALLADLAPADGTISLVGGSRYYVKVWGSGIGHWRPVTEDDGFVRRVTDSIHPSTGYNAMGNLVWAWIKATM